MKGVLPWVGLLSSSCRYRRFLSCLGCSSRPSAKYIFFLTVHYFTSFVSIAHGKLDRHAVNKYVFLNFFASKVRVQKIPRTKKQVILKYK
jgi:hypothetical protein